MFYLQALHVEEYQAQQEQKLVRELEAMVRIKNPLLKKKKKKTQLIFIDTKQYLNFIRNRQIALCHINLRFSRAILHCSF